MRVSICVIATLLGACVWAHGEGKETTVAQLTLTSASFRNNQPMPAKHSCEGEDSSPALKWDGAPAGTKSFALICDDPDAPGGTWVHWVIYNIPDSIQELSENVPKMESLNDGARQGKSDFGSIGY